ncbi:MAG: NUDIX domain-containing protein [Halobacteriales archaeon]
MSDQTAVVTCFLRHQGEIALLKRAATRGTYPERWAGVSGYLEHGDPIETARMEIREEVGLGAPRIVRSGSAIQVVDESVDRTWTVHPFLFDVEHRDFDPGREHSAIEWVPATAILRRSTVPDLWRTYRQVGPSVETVADDTEHGSATISIHALEALRDRAGELAVKGDSLEPIQIYADRLLDARPGMAALQNRINRAMANATSPAAVESAAIAGIERAIDADTAAAANAAETIADSRVLTLSRSGTVIEALAAGTDTVVVAESRPAREGITVAETLAAEGVDVTVCTDAAMASLLADADSPIETVLVGADTVLADGRVVNKTGTRSAALAAAHEDVPLYVVAASDKIAFETTPTVEEGPGSAVYDGDADLTPVNPTFDVTPTELVDGVITEDGVLTSDDIEAVAMDHRSLTTWPEPNDDGMSPDERSATDGE